MKIAFYSNFMNHHHLPFSLKMLELTENNYYFVACTPIEQERLDMGYEDMNKKYDFIIRPYESKEQDDFARKLAEDCDVMIFGSGDEKFLKRRMELGKLTFRYAERPFKKGLYRRFIPIIRKKINDRFIRYKNNNMYILCSSAYTSFDLKLCGFPEEKCLRWGYFPENKTFDIEKKFREKSGQAEFSLLEYIGCKFLYIEACVCKPKYRRKYKHER